MNKLFFATIFGITILSSCGNAPEDKTTKKTLNFNTLVIQLLKPMQ